MKTTELELASNQSLVAPSPAQGVSLESAFQAVVNGDLNSEKLAVLKDLLAMNAQRQFAQAFNELQKDLPILTATTEIPNRGKYLRYEDMMRDIGPILTRHGFSISCDQDWKDGRVVVTVNLLHVGGFSRPTCYAVRVPEAYITRSGNKSDSDTQLDCKASTTAKRNAVALALNIVIQQDCLNEENDAKLEGGPITLEQADSLRARVRATKSNEAFFLKFAGAETFETIHSSALPRLNEQLARKEKS